MSQTTTPRKRVWTEKEKAFVARAIKEHIPLQDICDTLGRTERAVRQYMFAARLPRRMDTVKNNLVKALLLLRIPDPECFRPNRAFYNAVNITQKRWWKLYFGEDKATPAEYQALARYFNISLEEAFEARQLDLFPEDDGSAAHSEN